MIRKSTNVIKLWKTFIPSAIVAMLIGCGKKDGNKDAIYDVDNYPVAEISEGLAQAAQTFSEVFEFHDSWPSSKAVRTTALSTGPATW